MQTVNFHHVLNHPKASNFLYGEILLQSTCNFVTEPTFIDNFKKIVLKFRILKDVYKKI